jgi:two-component system, cell cycle response regulator
MTARILVVDDIDANVKLLQARLTAEYFDVVTATSGLEALAKLEEHPVDIVLLDVMMPGMDGFEVCRRIKADSRVHHVPVVMITALDQPADRVRGLEAGADDFLTKPVSDLALLTRVRSLVRLKQLTDELRLRAETSRELGIVTQKSTQGAIDGANGRVLLVDDRRSSFERIVTAMRGVHRVEVETSASEALLKAGNENFDLIVVSLDLQGVDGLRLCSQIRSVERLRQLPILVLVDPDETARLLRGLDLGVNDYLMRPLDKNELLARVATQVKRKRHADQLRDTLQQSMELAIRDGLTGLHNRRYLESHLASLVRLSLTEERGMALLVLDIDHFKRVNDTHGHDAGDEVIREFARRIRKVVRGIDLCARFGGEEFVVVMPDTDVGFARSIAERIRERVAEVPFAVADGAQQLDVTVSIGLAWLELGGDSPEQLIQRADQALYAAKRSGRNRVMSEAA